MFDIRPISPIAWMLEVRPTATTPPSVGAVSVFGRNDEVPNVNPPKPWTEELPTCARAAAGTTTRRTIARASALRIGHSNAGEGHHSNSSATRRANEYA